MSCLSRCKVKFKDSYFPIENHQPLINITQQKPHVSQQIRINVETLLQEIKRVRDEAILANYNHLPTMFADTQEFEVVRKLVEQKYFSANSFNAYKKVHDQHLKSLEEKLNHRFSLFSTNRSKHKTDETRKATFNIVAIIQFFKNHNPQWLIRILIFISICMIAVYLFSSIHT